ncbi:MAG: T9SS type A sorting domain-containing protein [Bacteroidales bacterium]|nr:T9SS type A sorting domain-containing protein [Bacteroidales bacterium]
MAQASACALYPNPARDYTGIKGLIDNELIELRIGYLGGSLYDKYLKHKRTLALFIGNHETDINVNDINPGVYYIVLYTNQFNADTEKLIIK